MADVPQPINVSSNPTPEQIATLGRDIALVLAALPALMAAIGAHNINALVVYFRSTNFGELVTALSPFVIGGVVLWRQWNTRRDKRVKVELAEAAPNATVDSKGTPTNA